ncbi:WecB/TagA/CpsF family glycosyltransferase [Stratiformator vulcanicus]|uniref:N-acetylmannosaminyltransferase n=1 Tax=Stratiformator vulcanicus TaxID=2527980 RepID=A0A517R434_9PLAN|nr:WecB/TagA/CpsF family glycosyltransferase [Stratiformator vulcanicus]QDT38631.1 Putative N-acetylmannosaminyltransferase [Stratiformator vulcanicus]
MSTATIAPQRLRHVRIFDIDIAAASLAETADHVVGWFDESQFEARFVVTPNVDHIVMLRENEELHEAYRTASLVTADGAPLVLAARLLGRPLPERVAGSDLVPAIFDRASIERSITVFLLGAVPGVAARAAEQIELRWPHVTVVGTDSPPLGFEHSTAESDRIVEKIAEVSPDVLVVGFGAPKQELWVARHSDRIEAKAVLCAGATIDFLAGEKMRAPRWAQRIGMEWLHRLASEPRRLFKRYFRDACVFPRIVLSEWLHRPTT